MMHDTAPLIGRKNALKLTDYTTLAATCEQRVANELLHLTLVVKYKE